MVNLHYSVSGHTLYRALNQTNGNSGRGGGVREAYMLSLKKRKKKIKEQVTTRQKRININVK